MGPWVERGREGSSLRQCTVDGQGVIGKAKPQNNTASSQVRHGSGGDEKNSDRIGFLSRVPIRNILV